MTAARLARMLYANEKFPSWRPSQRLEILQELLKENAVKLVDKGYPKALIEARKKLVDEILETEKELL